MSVEPESWVVYLRTVHGKAEALRAVCDQAEWDEMEGYRPGYHKMIQNGILSERTAELLARGTSGDSVKRKPKL
jgi:hypothetical protein